MFKQARQNRTFEDVILQIQDAILCGELKEGDRLPSERKLGEIFKVSRGTLREALRVLEQKGLITIRTGVRGGAQVSPVNARMREGLGLLLRLQKISLRELAEFREVVEGAMAAQAARKATRADANDLRSCVDRIQEYMAAPESLWEQIREEDNKFHRLLSRIAGNRLFESVLDIVYTHFQQYFDQYLPKEERIAKRIHRDLRAITEAIRTGDEREAFSLVQGHIQWFNAAMEKRERHQRKIPSDA
jgi:GntR family transcriptional repressor for pyruvate dehydrogenase complex